MCPWQRMLRIKIEELVISMQLTKNLCSSFLLFFSLASMAITKEYVILLLSTLIFCHALNACPVKSSQRNKDLSRLDEVVRSGDGEFVNLENFFTHSSKRSHESEKLVRVELGGNVSLHCRTAQNTHFPNIEWKYNGQNIECQTKQENQTQCFVVFINNTSTFRLLNFLASATGQYTCLHNTEIIEVFTLRPKYRLSDVFRSIPVNVSARWGKRSELLCTARLTDRMQNIRNRVIWRYDNRVLVAPDNHPAQALIDPRERLSFNHGSAWTTPWNCWCTFIFILEPAQTDALGRHECWVQPDASIDEWIIQPIYVNLVL